ncbi:aspartate/glutamate racemase family protein [Caballeronia sp. dw_276]|uniref:aspartate/glutamate racemase family protein n=1 Tax=Caballeronia sp. dw_276 TaxID=2719795 RepID=UPI001BD5D16F|nr:aspartate/glutamate racemase family protein [Caballeronia sp. dw_276]
MTHILLLNPNTSVDTTAMMVDIARSYVPEYMVVIGVTAESGVPMITTEAELDAAAQEVVACWQRQREQPAGMIVSAFGDPGLGQLRAMTDVPIVGLCEAAMLEASEEGRRFGVATVTPDLVTPIDQRAFSLQLSDQYTGIRLTLGNPRELANDPQKLIEALAVAIEQSIAIDGAEAVIIGGGPLGQAASALTGRFSVPIIAPVPAATRQLMRLL